MTSLFNEQGHEIFDLFKISIIGKILMSRAHKRPLKIFKVFLYIFNYYFKKLSGTGKNYAYCKCEELID